MDNIVIQTHALTKTFGKRTAVNQLHIEVRRGEIFGFLGPNGAGKTTTIRMLLGLITPTSGSISILGRPVTTEHTEVLPRVGALIETPALYNYMNGRDNLRTVASMFGPVDERQIDNVLTIVGLAGRQRDRVQNYSLGMKQRLGVAMAMLNDPHLLVLDEPANGLDPAGIVEMRDLMRNLAAIGKTVLISSHVLGEVQQICTRVAIINNGILIREASVDELTRGQGIYVVFVERVAEALALVQAQPWGAQAVVNPQGALMTAAPNGLGRELNTFLSQAGYVPDALYYQQETLEQVFLRLTANPGGGIR